MHTRNSYAKSCLFFERARVYVRYLGCLLSFVKISKVTDESGAPMRFHLFYKSYETKFLKFSFGVFRIISLI